MVEISLVNIIMDITVSFSYVNNEGELTFATKEIDEYKIKDLIQASYFDELNNFELIDVW